MDQDTSLDYTGSYAEILGVHLHEYSEHDQRRLTFRLWEQFVEECNSVTVVPGTVSEGLNGWSEALTAGLAVKTAKPLS